MTQFCWIYKHSRKPEADELRLSIRSVVASFPDAKITLVGDAPDWYTGLHIPVAFQLLPQYAEYRDTLNKLFACVDSPLVAEEFVWMMDDIYFVQPTTLGDLKVPRVDFNLVLPDTTWRRLKLRTQEWLVSHNYSSHDYATHLPHVVTKTNLIDMQMHVPIRTTMFLWEICYGNLYRTNPISYDPFLHRVLQKRPAEYFDTLSPETKVLNNSTTGWSPGFSSWLYSKFSTPSPYEKV